MAKQLNVNLAFTADTSQAKAQIQELQTTLNKIAYSGNSTNTMTQQTTAIQQAASAAKELQLHLNNAFDANTGKFDLSKLNKSLQASGSNIGDLSTKLLQAGTTGEQAFAQLARSISQANQPTLRLNGALTEMWTVMKNTMRWQLSSSMIHGFIGTVKSAYGYAKDLNESLNNIRIVTQSSAVEMADFAKEANKAAKALSTTTTEYTDAALIYYQQGLDDEAVLERTNATIKMANASGQSAQVVSDQLTAVWNNFDDGSKSLEYYADVMVALGAATASSSEEIATGLEKFAAIAETVGLSYEYATAALATITANTRQSADVVGNALKTLFARIQGLSLGETLEDGVDLNKYSKALAAVGVNVLDANGQMREMNQILDDLAAKWDAIGKAEQTALAQTVAGVRQYTQLVALMENWDDMKTNLNTAYGAEGALEEQQKIYEESWQASIDRVKAAAEGIYDSLLNDKFFININDGFANMLGGLESFIDGIGGAKGVILAFSSILISNFSNKIPDAIDNLRYNFTYLTKGAQEAYSKIQVDMSKAYQSLTPQQQNSSTGVEIKYSNELTAARSKLAMVTNSMSTSERQMAEMELQLIEAQKQELVELTKKNEELKRSIELQKEYFQTNSASQGYAQVTKKSDSAAEDIQSRMIAAKSNNQQTKASRDLSQYYTSFGRAYENVAVQIDTIGQKISQAFIQNLETGASAAGAVSIEFAEQAGLVDQVHSKLNSSNISIEEARTRISEISTLIPATTKNAAGLKQAFDGVASATSKADMLKKIEDLKTKLSEAKIESKDFERVLKELYGDSSVNKLKEDIVKYNGQVKEATNLTERLNQALKNFRPAHVVTGVEALSAAAGALGNVAMMMSSVYSIFNSLANPDLSGWEKVSSVFMGISMIVPMSIALLKSLGTTYSWLQAQALEYTAAKEIENIVSSQSFAHLYKEYIQIAKNIVVKELNAGATREQAIAIAAKNLVETFGIPLEAASTAATLAHTVAEKGLALALWEVVTAAAAKHAVLLKQIGGFALLAAGIFIAIKAIDHFTTTQKEAQEAISEAVDSYEEEAQKLNELNKELETTQDRIKELQSMDSLSLVEQEELNRLKQTEASLERQVKLQERLASIEREKALNEISKNWKTEAGHVGNRETAAIYDVRELGFSAIETGLYQGKTHLTKDEVDQYIATKEKQWEDALAAGTTDKLDFTFEDLQNWKSYADTAYSSRYAENAMSIMNNYQNLQDMYKESLESGDEDQARRILATIKEMTSSDQFANAMDVTYGEDYEKEVLADYLYENVNTDQIKTAWGDDKNRQAIGEIDSKNIFGEDALALAGITSERMDSYVASALQSLKQNTNISEEQLLALSPNDLALLVEKSQEIINSNTDFSQVDLKEFLNDTILNDQERADRANERGLAQAKSYGIDTAEFEAYREMLREHGEEIENVNQDLSDQPELLNEIALAHKRTAKGLKTISKNWDDWNKIIQKGDYEELSGIMEELNSALADVLNYDSADMENLSDDFAVENWDLITKAMKGVEGAYEDLQVAAAKDIAVNVGLNADDITSQMEELMGQAAAMADGTELVITPEIDNKNAIDGLYDLLTQAGMTTDQIAAIFEGLGWEPEIEYEKVDWKSAGALRAQGYQEYATLNPDGSYSTHSLPLDGEQVLNQGGDVYVPKLKSATKKGSGRGITAPPSSSGGGGGGGSKKPEKKSSSDKQRYHTVTNQLEDLEDAYDDVSKAAERAFGKDKLALMDEQIAKTDDLIDKQQEYVDAIEANLEPDKQAFVGLYDKYIQGPEIQFDASGNISNFDEIQDAMHDLYNKNSESMSEDEWEIFKEHYEQVEKYLEQYEETYDLLREEESKMQDLVNQRIDLLLEKVKYEVELKLSIADDSLEILEFQLGRLDDNAFAVAQTMALLSEKANIVQGQLETNIKGMQDVLKQSGVSEVEIQGFINGDIGVDALASQYNFTEEQINTLRDYKSGALDALEAMQDLREETQNKVSEAFDAWNEQLQDSLDKFNHLNNTLNSYKNIIDIVGKEMLGVTKEIMDDLNKTIVDNAINQLDSSRRAWEALRDAEQTAKDALAQAYASGIQEDIDYWEDEVKRINSEAESAQETMMSNWENTLTIIVEQFEKAVEEAVESFNKSFTADGSFLSDAYEQRQKENERYIEDYQKIYELSKLTRDINNSIDDTDNLASKKKLKELLAEINEYEAEGVQMSEYDVEHMQKKYDLYKAQIALQEAQAAKDTVRLTKDNEGNWSYAYTTDTSKIEQAEQEYEDALYALQELNYEYLAELESSIVDTMEEMTDALTNIKREDFATYAEYQAEIDRVTAFYMDQMAYYQSEMQQGIDNNKKLYEEDWEAYNRITGYKISKNEDFITSWKETTMGQLTESESETVDIYQRVVDSLDVLIAGLLDAYETMSTDIDSANEAAGTSTEGFGDQVSDVIDDVKDESAAAGEAVEDMANQMEAGFDSATTALLKWQSQYSSAMEKAVSDTLGVVDAFNLLIKTLAEGEPVVNGSNSSGGSYGSNKGSGSEDKKTTEENKDTPTYRYDPPKASAKESLNEARQQSSSGATASDGKKTVSSWLKDLVGLSTGGYTGDWSDESGRLALLHQKELVLNQEDTANMLSTVKLVRQLTNTIDLNAQAASVGMGLLRAQTIKDEKTSDILQQEVTIHAEFPNVSDQNEIKMALSDLVNTASQYANRK